MINHIKITMLTKKSELYDFSDAHIAVKGDITVTKPDNAKRNKSVAFKILRHLSTTFQKSMAYKLATQKTQML